MKSSKWNKKVAKNRGDEWRDNLVKGKIEAKMYPTKLQILRAKNKKSQEEIAQAVGLSLTTYGAIERAKRTVKPTKALEIAKFLKASENRLFKKNKQGKLTALK